MALKSQSLAWRKIVKVTQKVYVLIHTNSLRARRKEKNRPTLRPGPVPVCSEKPSSLCFFPLRRRAARPLSLLISHLKINHLQTIWSKNNSTKSKAAILFLFVKYIIPTKEK